MAHVTAQKYIEVNRSAFDGHENALTDLQRMQLAITEEIIANEMSFKAEESQLYDPLFQLSPNDGSSTSSSLFDSSQQPSAQGQCVYLRVDVEY